MPDQDIIALLLQLLAEEKQIDQAIAIDIQPQSNWDGQWQLVSKRIRVYIGEVHG